MKFYGVLNSLISLHGWISHLGKVKTSVKVIKIRQDDKINKIKKVKKLKEKITEKKLK